MATVAPEPFHRDKFVIGLDVEEAIYLRDVLATEWDRAHDYGAKELADALTRALAR